MHLALSGVGERDRTGVLRAAADEFAELARRVVLSVDALDADSVDEAVPGLLALLAEAYGAGAMLPDDFDDDELSDREPPGDGGARQGERRVRLEQALGAGRVWTRLVYDPYEDLEAVTGSLAGDLEDVATGLERGLALWRAGGTSADALLEWQVGLGDALGAARAQRDAGAALRLAKRR